MTTNALQAPFELIHNNYEYTNGFDASSPPSSPSSPYEVDSSPPSSPLHEPFYLDTSDTESETIIMKNGTGQYVSPDTSPSSIRRGDVKGKGKLLTDLDASPAHPFSASTRAIKRPPSYSKDSTRQKVKRHKNEQEVAWNTIGMTHLGRVGVHERDGYIQSVIPSLVIPSCEEPKSGDERKPRESPISPTQDPEHTLWEETIAQAVDAAECRIDLSGHGLTYIPPKIADLSKLVVIRDPTTPARELAPRRTCSKSTNSIVFGAGKLGHREDEIHLFLSKNFIKSLPNELFNLDALVVLSLRANCLTEIPPLICQLRNLRELNVANNKLRYLPSEIMSLKLSSLAVEPNPFEENPFAKSAPSRERWFGPVRRNHTIVPLVELVLRVLLAPSYEPQEPLSIMVGNRRQETVLEHFYGFPLPSNWVRSPLLRDTLSSCVPGSVSITQSPHTMPYSSPESSQSVSTSIRQPCVSVCPSMRHLVVVGGKYRRPVFVGHAEERLSWEKQVAGQRVGGENGIPVRWRGCNMGCLDYLEQADSSTTSVAGDDVEDDWPTSMDVDSIKDSDGTTSAKCTSEQPSSKDEFKAFDSADIDLGD